MKAFHIDNRKVVSLESANRLYADYRYMMTLEYFPFEAITVDSCATLTAIMALPDAHLHVVNRGVGETYLFGLPIFARV